MKATRTTRLGLRATPEQKALLQRAAEIEHKSLSDFVLESACRAAEKTLLDQPLLIVSEERFQAFQELLDRPEQPNEGLNRLFSRDG